MLLRQRRAVAGAATPCCRVAAAGAHDLTGVLVLRGERRPWGQSAVAGANTALSAGRRRQRTRSRRLTGLG